MREIRSVPKPSQLLAAEQADSPSWRALVREADEPPAPGVEYERCTATWRNLQAAALAAGQDDTWLGHEVHVRARRYRRAYSTPYSTPALGANWSKLAHDPPARPESSPARASPGDTEALIAAQPPKTRRLLAAGQRFIERGEHGQDAVFQAFLPPGRGVQQRAERPADGAVVREVRHLPGGDVHGGGQPRDG